MGNWIVPMRIAALLLGASQTNAGLLPVAANIAPEGGDYRYTYSVQLQSGAILNPGDYFTIYDFDGFIAGSNAQPAGFTFSSAPVGPTPAHVSPDDNAHIANLTWTYTGAGTTGPSDLGSFTALSQFGTTADDSFTGQTHRVVDGQLNGNVTDTHVPVPLTLTIASMPSCHQVSEPRTLLLVLAGLPLLAGVRWLRRRT